MGEGSHLQSVETVDESETGTRVSCVRKARPRNGCGVRSGGKKLAERSQGGVAERRRDGKANLTRLPGVPTPSDTISTFILCPFTSRGEASEACLCSEGRILNSLLEGRNVFSRQHRGSLRIKQQQVLSAGSTLRSKETPKLSSMPVSTKSNPPEEWSPNNSFGIGGSPLSEEKARVTDSCFDARSHINCPVSATVSMLAWLASLLLLETLKDQRCTMMHACILPLGTGISPSPSLD